MGAILIVKEDPDIIIGYNIFGFDYNFMYLSASENSCVEEFLKLSRSKMNFTPKMKMVILNLVLLLQVDNMIYHL